METLDPEFRPDLAPKEMLELGVFGGLYFDTTESREEFPADWFKKAKLAPEGARKPIAALNYFGMNASQPRSVWEAKGWMSKEDPLGWFQWYCRYYTGRRLPKEDSRQIKRWHAIGRHIAQVKNNCRAGDETCRPRQRQAILHWAYDSRKM